MANVVRSVTLKAFDPARYPNPALQWHYKILQAIALDEELPEQPEDKTVPKYSTIHKRTGAFALEWMDALESEEAPKTKATSNVKEEDGHVNKKVKREKKNLEPPSGDKIESLYEQGTLMTVFIQWISLIC
jgi:ATP-dependent DNA helicase 2 subunit 1